MDDVTKLVEDARESATMLRTFPLHGHWSNAGITQKGSRALDVAAGELDQAADTITRLSARVEELEAKLDSLEEDYVFDLDRFGDA